MTAEDHKRNQENQVITFGCRLNSYESEGIRRALQNSDAKNLIVFNSCAVTSAAESELRSSIRKAKKQNPTAKIVVTGCAAQTNPKAYSKMKEVDLVLGNAYKNNPQSYISNTSEGFYNFKEEENLSIKNSLPSRNQHQNQLFFSAQKSVELNLTSSEEAKIRVNDIMSVRKTAPQLVSYFENQTRAFLEIQNGCNHRCTFCIIPFGRGNSRSVPFGEIVSGIRKLVESGHKEVVLTGVDISDYGLDLPASLTLAQMIKRLLKLIPEIPRLRLSSVDVAELDTDFLEILATEPRFMPYLHLSVQSGDDLILKRMARRHNRQQILDFCQKARKLRPEISFGADIIAGFPTENEEMFQNSLALISEADLIFTHIFPYSKRSGTPAAKMPQIDGKIIKERAKQLRESGEKQLKQFLAKQLGKEFLVLMEKDKKGKTENFLDIKLPDETGNQINPGEILKVKITDYQGRNLLGKIT